MKRVALLALVAASTLLLSGCIPGLTPISMDKDVELIYQADFSQSQAIEGFDDSEYTIADGDPALDAFITQLQGFGIEPWNYTPPDADGCAGGITTTVHVLYHGAGEDTMVITACGAPDDSFESVVTRMFSEYREAQTSELPNHDIVSLTFTQSQALPEFDTSEHTQDHPQQVARFVAILDTESVVWSEGVDPALLGTPCPGSITTQITAHYTGTDLVVGPVEVGGCSDIGFVDEITALFSEWRATS